MEFNLGSYGKIYASGNKFVQSVFNGPVVIQEKVDGSQFSWCLNNGELYFRSRKQQMRPFAYEGMFAAGIKAIEEIKDLLTPDVIYRGEYLSKPKHNALTYDRIPLRNIILFDIEAIEDGPECYYGPELVQKEAERLGMECVPTYYEGIVTDVEKQVLPFLKEKTPILGGKFIEGVVIKNYERPTEDGHFMKAKIVAEDFKEVHSHEWKKANPSSKDIVQSIVDSYRTEPRWEKSIQHLRDDEILQDAPQDIGPLIKAVNQDILEECKEEIKDTLFNHYWKDISRGITKGLPEYYKRKLIGVEMGIDV